MPAPAPSALPAEPESTRPPFREEALRHWQSARRDGHLLRIAPVWTAWAYRLIVGVVALAVLYGALGTVAEYATGPAIVRVDGRRDLTARAEGVVSDILVRPGQRVAAGQLLVRLHVGPESADLERASREFEWQLVKVLRDPGDLAAREALTTLRAGRDLARARIEERTVRAPEAGTVSDVRVRPGQHLAPGDVIASVASDRGACSIVAILPGQYRPLLVPGMPLRVALDGFRYAYSDLVIDSVGDEIVGPAELRRYLGPDLADTVAVSGPALLVRAHLPSRTFTADGRTYRYHDGLHGRADVRVRTESILVALIPGLKALVEPTHAK